MDTMLREALRKHRGLRQQVENVLLGEDSDIWEAELKKFVAKRPCWVNVPKVAEKSNPFLRRLYGKRVIRLDATDGTETLAQASDVFTGWVDQNFKNLDLDLPGKARSMEQVTVHEMVKNGTFAGFYDSLGDLNDLRLSQGQIKQFARRHASKLHPRGWSTFFLFTREDKPVNEDRSNVFVACVRKRQSGGKNGKLEAHVRKFLSKEFWLADNRRRFVIPQLKT